VIYELRHRTTYDYEDPVTFARCVLRLTPQSSGRQTVLRSTVTVTPTPSDTLHRTGAFGEHTITVVIDKPHKALIIEGRSKVDVHAPAITPQMPSAAWEDIRTASYRSPDLGADSPAAFLYPTRRTAPIGMITDYARRSFTPGRPILQAAAELMTRIKADFTYDPEATEVSTPTAEAFEARHGVCQDFAHVMISGLRGLGLPVAYVSGYLVWRHPGLGRLRPHQRHPRPGRPHRARRRSRLFRRRPHRRRHPRPRRPEAEGRGRRDPRGRDAPQADRPRQLS
jgi:transglutaminase-like putative cysteine protease